MNSDSHLYSNIQQTIRERNTERPSYMHMFFKYYCTTLTYVVAFDAILVWYIIIYRKAWKVGIRKLVYHTSWVTVATPTGRPKSVPNCS